MLCLLFPTVLGGFGVLRWVEPCERLARSHGKRRFHHNRQGSCVYLLGVESTFSAPKLPFTASLLHGRAHRLSCATSQLNPRGRQRASPSSGEFFPQSKNNLSGLRELSSGFLVEKKWLNSLNNYRKQIIEMTIKIRYLTEGWWGSKWTQWGWGADTAHTASSYPTCAPGFEFENST